MPSEDTQAIIDAINGMKTDLMSKLETPPPAPTPDAAQDSGATPDASPASAISPDAARVVAAYQQVLRAHNISFTPSDEQLARLRVVDGAVVGDIGYQIASARQGVSENGSGAQQGQSSTPPITAEALAHMTPAEINARWSEISKLEVVT